MQNCSIYYRKKSTYKWTSAVQTRVVQGSAVLALGLAILSIHSLNKDLLKADYVLGTELPGEHVRYNSWLQGAYPLVEK